MNLKYFTLLILLLVFAPLFSQKSESLIPKDAVIVFSINNFKLLQKISLDELINYEFMEEIHQELFDGSTSGKTLKEAGLDFDQKLNVFSARLNDCEISGFSFGIKNKEQLFTVFDDFYPVSYPKINGIEVYGSFVNTLIIKNEVALLIRVEPLIEQVNKVADSIWYARGNESPFNDEDLEEETILSEEIFDEERENLFPIASFDPNEKNYNELKDSVQLVLQNKKLTNILDELFKQNINLIASNRLFEKQLTHPVEAIFFLDNARNLNAANELWYLQTILPRINKDIEELYEGNFILGDLCIIDNKVEFNLEVLYNEKLGSIYQELSNSNFDSKVLKYIPESSTAYFTSNMNLREAYEKAFEVIMPLLEKKNDSEMAINLLIAELLNEFVDKDALFGTCKGSLFGFFNGIKKIKIKKIEYVYDENFNYIPQSTDADEDMPIFTFGFSIDRTDIPEKVFKHLERSTLKIVNMGNYWRYDNAILDAAPLYMICKNGLFLFTNDEDLALNHSQGYGDKAISHSDVKKTMKSNLIYTLVDVGTTLKRFPVDLFGSKENQIIESLRGKTGIIQLKTTKAKKKNANIQLTYSDFSDNQTGKHLLDLINAIYVASK